LTSLSTRGDRGLSLERQQLLLRLFSTVGGIASQLTQQQYYKDNFSHVLENLAIDLIKEATENGT
jgi:hypothetical protein